MKKLLKQQYFYPRKRYHEVSVLVAGNLRINSCSYGRKKEFESFWYVLVGFYKYYLGLKIKSQRRLESNG